MRECGGGGGGGVTEVDCAQQRWHQAAEQIQVRVRDLRVDAAAIPGFNARRLMKFIRGAAFSLLSGHCSAHYL